MHGAINVKIGLDRSPFWAPSIDVCLQIHLPKVGHNFVSHSSTSWSTKRSISYTFHHVNYESVDITNKMQPCNRIYYSKVYWGLNMFRTAYRSSSGALNCIFSLWFIYTCGDRPLSRLSLDNDRSPHGYLNQRLQIQFRAPDDERCAARNMLNPQ